MCERLRLLLCIMHGSKLPFCMARIFAKAYCRS